MFPKHFLRNSHDLALEAGPGPYYGGGSKNLLRFITVYYGLLRYLLRFITVYYGHLVRELPRTPGVRGPEKNMI